MTEIPADTEGAHESFIGILLFDVIDAIERHGGAGSQSSKRDLIRTGFAAIEGVAWIFREHIVDAARTTSNLDPAEEVALSEISYQVTEQGKITGQTKYLSLIATIRLTARIAEKLSPDVKIDFSESGWVGLQQAIKVRNRITHPKSRFDLVLSDEEVRTSVGALFWLLEEVERVMAAANVAIKEYLVKFSEILTQLKKGDPAILAEYQAAADALQENGRRSIQP